MSARDVARAIDSLRRGWPIAIRGGGAPVGLLAIETADAGRLAAFDPAGDAPILLSAGRAATLKLANQIEAAIPDSPVLVERTFWIDFDCAVALADPQLDMATPMKGPFRAIPVTDRDVMAAALGLARTAGVLPAFFVGAAPADGTVTIADIEDFEDEYVERLDLGWLVIAELTAAFLGEQVERVGDVVVRVRHFARLA